MEMAHKDQWAPAQLELVVELQRYVFYEVQDIPSKMEDIVMLTQNTAKSNVKVLSPLLNYKSFNPIRNR